MKFIYASIIVITTSSAAASDRLTDDMLDPESWEATCATMKSNLLACSYAGLVYSGDLETKSEENTVSFNGLKLGIPFTPTQSHIRSDENGTYVDYFGNDGEYYFLTYETGSPMDMSNIQKNRDLALKAYGDYNL